MLYSEQGDTTSGQRIFYQFGMTSIPIYNTNNACATGSTGLHLARTLVRNGAADCVLVIGFEQMNPGSIKSVWSDRPSPMGLSTTLMEETRGKFDTPRNAQYFANAGREYMEKCVDCHAEGKYFGLTSPSAMAPARVTLQRSQESATSTPRGTLTLNSSRNTLSRRSPTRP